VLNSGPIAEWPASLDEALAEAEERRRRRAAENQARYEAALRGKGLDAPQGSVSQQDFRMVSERVYAKMLALMRQAARSDWRRVRGVLSVVEEKNEGRNDVLYWGARRMRELIAGGVISYGTAETLLLEAAKVNGYVQKDGYGEAMATIHSGLGEPKPYGAFNLEEVEG
jgi:hypothetical protein